MSVTKAIVDDIGALLAAASIQESIRDISFCSSGGNNRVYRVETTSRTFAAKHYFRDELDTRDRLAAEYAFLRYSVQAAPGTTPLPYACDVERGLALYEFIEGRPLHSGEVDSSHIDAAIGFFEALNRSEMRIHAAQLSNAAEACFSIREHLDLVSARVRSLSDVATTENLDRPAREFIFAFAHYWDDLRASIIRHATGEGLDWNEPLEPSQRCVSPSDFGFHNALVESDGRIRFLDFEYAGWDDPAKTAGDFFSQLAVPVPQNFFDRFVQGTIHEFARPDDLARRASLLRPVYRIKWCAIALNVFHPVHLARRKFADPSLDETTLKAAQLMKAQQLFRSIPETGVVD